MKVLLRGVAILVSTLVLLQGCTGSQEKPEAEEIVIEERTLELPDEGVVAEGLERAGEVSLAALGDPLSPLSDRVFYFAFDSSDLESDDMDRLALHAQLITRYPELSVIVEGHADERGTREYNLALSERRALTVQRLLSLQGGSDSQMQVIGFGEERPAAQGHDESTWQRNRRVVLVYSGT